MIDMQILIGSITYTMKAKKILSSHAINATIIKYDSPSHRGCTYGLKFQQNQHMTIVGILNQHNIRYQILGSDDTVS